MTIRKVDPQPSAPRPVAKPSAPVTTRPAPPDPAAAKLNAQVGRTSSFEAFKPGPLALPRRDPNRPVEGRGTNDDSIGRGTNDDSIGRGTNDDSIGRGTNDDSIGRGTNDDSIGTQGASITRATSDAGIGSAEEPTARGTALVPGREGLTPETGAQMDRLLAPDEPRRARQAAYVFGAAEFQALPAAARTQIVSVMEAGGPRAARAMAEMFEQSGGAMLREKGSDGTPLLDNLARLAASPSGKEVVGDLMYDLVNPGRIWQGRAPTCTVSTMQYELAHEDPGEYARLMTGLVVDGKVTLRGGGELVTNARWDLYASNARGDHRSGSEAVFQAAAMEFANGSDTYLEYSQTSVGGAQQYRGLHGDQIRDMVGQLFGTKYQTKEIGSDDEATEELNEILARERPSRPVLFDIMIDGSQSNHCVSLEGVKNGRVYYRDPTTGETESMTPAEFRQSLVAVHYAPPTFSFSSLVGRFKDLFS